MIVLWSRCVYVCVCVCISNNFTRCCMCRRGGWASLTAGSSRRPRCAGWSAPGSGRHGPGDEPPARARPASPASAPPGTRPPTAERPTAGQQARQHHHLNLHKHRHEQEIHKQDADLRQPDELHNTKLATRTWQSNWFLLSIGPVTTSQLPSHTVG